jgi:oligoribonuclease
MDNVFAAAVDMETTGLDANSDVPLEIGVALIDKDGNVLDTYQTLVWEPGPDYSIAMGMAAANEFVGPMHEKSGLWDDLLEKRGKETLSREEADYHLVSWLADHEVGQIPMLGNSIGSLDRPFALVHFPNFNKALSYRNIDMSSIKELVKVHNPTLWERLKPIIGDKSNADHRVMGDIEACLVEYKAYIDNFFFIEE